MATIVHNATIVTPVRGAVRVLRQHSLIVEAGRVKAIGPAADFEPQRAKGDFVEAIDGENHILTPGLVNTHHHLFQSLTRCLPAVQNERLFGWLLRLYGHWRDLDYRAVNLAAKVSIAELLLHGCTTTSDHFYMFPPGSDVRMEAVLDAAETLGIRIHLCRGSMSLGSGRGGLPPDDCVQPDADVLADCERVLKAYHDPASHALRRIDLAPCSPFNVTPELLRDTRDMARQWNVLLHTHAAETLEEQAFCQERYGCRPIRYLADLDWLGPDVYLAHCVWLDDGEIELLARTGSAVSLCPTSNMRLGSGLPLIEKLAAAGVRLGVGVDGSSSNDGGNLLAEARQVLLVARAQTRLVASDRVTDRERDRALFPAAEAFKLATVGGASCLGRQELGHLEPGAAADFAMFRSDDIALAGAAMHDPLAALMLCAAPRAEHVFVAGRPVVGTGRVTGLDQTALSREFNNLIAARLT